jgi:hypothetical protein
MSCPYQAPAFLKTPFDPDPVYEHFISYNGENIQRVKSVTNGREVSIIAIPYKMTPIFFGLDLYQQRPGKEWLYTKVYAGTAAVSANVAVDDKGQTAVFYRNFNTPYLQVAIVDPISGIRSDFSFSGFAGDAAIQAVKAIGESEYLFSVNYLNGTDHEIDIFRLNAKNNSIFSVYASQSYRPAGNQVYDIGICPDGWYYCVYRQNATDVIWFEKFDDSFRTSNFIDTIANMSSAKVVFNEGNDAPSVMTTRIGSPTSTVGLYKLNGFIWTKTIPDKIGAYNEVSPFFSGSDNNAYSFVIPYGPQLNVLRMTQSNSVFGGDFFSQDLILSKPYDPYSDLAFDVHNCKIDPINEGIMSISWRSGPDSGIRIYGYLPLK